jgi:hypothetical protein
MSCEVLQPQRHLPSPTNLEDALEMVDTVLRLK